jgi:hypothetical protein
VRSTVREVERMSIPRFSAEASLHGRRGRYTAHFVGLVSPMGTRSRQASVIPALRASVSNSVVCGICRLQGCNCETVCQPCGPGGWFRCCDSFCVNCPGEFGGGGVFI